jgi:hypothetical protein
MQGEGGGRKLRFLRRSFWRREYVSIFPFCRKAENRNSQKSNKWESGEDCARGGLGVQAWFSSPLPLPVFSPLWGLRTEKFRGM